MSFKDLLWKISYEIETICNNVSYVNARVHTLLFHRILVPFPNPNPPKLLRVTLGNYITIYPQRERRAKRAEWLAALRLGLFCCTQCQHHDCNSISSFDGCADMGPARDVSGDVALPVYSKSLPVGIGPRASCDGVRANQEWQTLQWRQRKPRIGSGLDSKRRSTIKTVQRLS